MLNMIRLHLLIFLITLTEALKYCENDIFTPINNTTVDRVKYCIAQCLDLTGPVVRKTECFYNSTNMKTKGCPRNYFPDPSKKTIICQDGFHDIYKPLSETWKVCDIIYTFAADFDAKTYTFTPGLNQNAIQRRIIAQNLGIKIVVEIGSHAEAFTRISEDSKLREEYAKKVQDLVQRHGFDGALFRWNWPDCPKGKCTESPKDRVNAVALIKAIGTALKQDEKLLLSHISGDPFIVFKLGDYYTDVYPIVDFFLIDTHNLHYHGTPKTGFHSNLIIVKEGIKFLLGKVKEPNFRRKLAMSITLTTNGYDLHDKKVTIIGTNHNGWNTKKLYYDTHEWCNLTRPGSGFQVFKDVTKQNYAVKDGHLIVFEDSESLRAKIQYYMGLGGGAIHIADTYKDDMRGECGAGKMPFIKFVGELVKSTTCDPLPFL